MQSKPDPVPGPLATAMIHELAHYVITEVQPVVVDLARCEGMWLMTVDGQRIFDWAGYYASKLLGHNHPGLYETDYLQRLVRAANNKVANPDFLTAECLEYYRTLHRLAPRCMRNPQLEVYAVNSGAEALENLMKYFINLHHERSGGLAPRGEKLRFIYFDQAFHGRTIFALNVTQTLDPVATKDFHGLIPGNIQVPFPGINTSEPQEKNRARTDEVLQRIEHFLERYAGEVVGMIVEPIQGAGGHRVAEPEFFQGLSRLAHAHGIFLGFDEVQTAGGPTGDVFMVDQLDLPHPPQAVAVAKKFGCGAVYMLRPMEDKGVLDSTWGGPLVDMVRFVQELKIVERENLVAAAKVNGEKLAAGLRALEKKFAGLIYNVRGQGLYQGFSLGSPALRNRLEAMALQEERLLLLGAGSDSIRLRPNLNVTDQDIAQLLELLECCLRRL
ncbi:MAG TPA: aminotransferase class III-fold pyridoxal phosphate-dependent enzyme [Verrucomicrobiae bacterium]|nr:aminotransferase class III-fold pyridoxal phosphate-dependent enzyme [Verrucomicrobiae bacterium]